MLEVMICSLVTILPDYLFRRYAQGKRFGKEITFYSVWFEFRWGLTACLMLTVGLITVVFYNHPSSASSRPLSSFSTAIGLRGTTRSWRRSLGSPSAWRLANQVSCDAILSRLR